MGALIRLATLGVLLIGACGQAEVEEAAATCVTSCGLVFEEEIPPSECREYQRVENRLLGVLPQVTSFAGDYACKRFKGVSVALHPTYWKSERHGRVQGLTTCGEPVKVEIVRGSHGTLAHELLHVVEGCNGHDNWVRRGFCFAIWWSTGDWSC